MSTLAAAALLWLAMTAIFATYLGLIRLVDRAHRTIAERDWGQR